MTETVAPPIRPAGNIAHNLINSAIRTATAQQMEGQSDRSKTVESRKALTKGLPPKERNKIRKRFEALDRSQETIEVMFGGDLQSAIHHQEALLQSPNLSPEDQIHVNETLTYLNNIKGNIKTEMRGFFDIAKKGHIDLARQLTESKIDRYTGLFLRGTLLDEFHRTIFTEWLKNPDSVMLNDHVVYALDMNNFKAGNNVLGHDGFDEFIAEMSQSFITASRYLGQDGAKECAYGKYDPDDEISKRSLDKVFPEGPQRQALDEARSQGVVIDFFRDKAGADEALFFVHYDQGKTPEREQMAEGLINRIFCHHALPKTGEKIKDDDLATLMQTAERFPNNLKIEGKDIAKTTAALGIPEPALAYLNKVADEIRYRIISSRAASPIVEDPDCRLRMGASFAKADMNQAFNRFVFGIPLEGDNAREVKGLLDPVTLEVNDQAMTDYVNHITSNVQLYLHAIGIKQPEILAEVMEEAIGHEAASPIIGATMGNLASHVENRQKGLDKLQLIVDAMDGDSESLYQLAALVQDGRIMDMLSSYHTRLLLLMTVERNLYIDPDFIRDFGEGGRYAQSGRRQAYEQFLTQKGISREEFNDFESLEEAFNKEFGYKTKVPGEEPFAERRQNPRDDVPHPPVET